MRLVHPEHSSALKHTAPDNLDFTGRIVHRLPEADGDAPRPPALLNDNGLPPLSNDSFSMENTMAFSMDALDFAMDEKVPVRTDYFLKAEIVQGRMGKIYSAEDPLLKLVVALKVSTVGDRTQNPKFSLEAEILAAIEHPNIVPIHNLEVHAEGRPFYSMKLIQGRTLQWIIRQLGAGDRETKAAYTRQQLLGVFRKVCDAVAFARDKGYLHRDLKPENIMVGAFGEVLFMDWGIAKTIRKPNLGPTPEVPHEAEPDTLPYIEGSPQYMSPEQANGVYGVLDERSDIYSLGGILYAILTSRPPVGGNSVAEVLENVRKGEITRTVLPRGSLGAGGAPLRMERALPEALRAVTLKALSLERDHRYQSVSAFVADIESYQNGFATSAEDASMFRQVALLVETAPDGLRAAALLLCGTALFTVRLAASERIAQSNAMRADKAARTASEQKLFAEVNEKHAVAEKQAARLALAQTHLTVAEAAQQRFNAEEIDTALSRVEPEFRTQEWNHLNNALDSSQRTFEAKAGCTWKDCVPHPARPGVLITLQSDNWLRTLDLNTGASENLFKMDGSIEAASLGVSPDAILVAVLESLASKPGNKTNIHQIAVWTLATGKKKTLSQTPLSGRGLLNFSPEGGKVMKVYINARNPDAGLSMFDVLTGENLWHLPCDAPYDAEFDSKSGRVYYVSNTESLELNARDGLPTGRPALTLQGTSNTLPVLIKALHVSKSSGLSLRHHVAGKSHFEVKLPGTLFGRMNLAVSTKDNCVAALCEAGDNSAVLQFRELDYGSIVQTVQILIDSQRHAGWRLTAHLDSGHYAVFRGKTMKVWNITRYPERVRLDTVYSNPTATSFAFLNTPDEILQFSPQKIATQDPQPFTVDVCQLKDSGVEVRREVHKPILPKFFTSNFSASRDGRTIAALALMEGEARLTTYRVQSNGAIVHQPRALPVAGTRMKISPDGDKIITGAGVRETLSGGMLQKHERSGASQLNYETLAQWCWSDNSHIVEIAFVSGPTSSEPNKDRRSFSGVPSTPHTTHGSAKRHRSDRKPRWRNARRRRQGWKGPPSRRKNT